MLIVLKRRELHYYDEIVFTKKLTPFAFKLYIVLWKLCDENERSYLTNNQYKDILGANENTVKRAFKQLESQKLIKVKKRFDDNGFSLSNEIIILPQKNKLKC